MAENKHKLKRQRMELTMDHEARTNEVFALVSDVCNGEVSKAICRCLDEFSSSANTTYAIEKIELEIEPMAYKDIKTQLADKVYDALRKALAPMFANFDETSRIEVQRIGDTEISAIGHFFEYGFLPWNLHGYNLYQLLTLCIENKAGELAKLIRTKGTGQHVRLRITERFNGELMQGIIRTLEAENSPIIIDYHKHLVTINQNECIVDVPQNALEKTLWLFILNHLIAEQQTAFNRKSFSVSMLRQFSCHYNIRFSDLLLLIHTGLQRWRKNLPEPFVGLLEDTVAAFAALPQTKRLARPYSEFHQDAHRPDDSGLNQAESEHLISADALSFLLDSNPTHAASLLRNFKEKPRTIHKLIYESDRALPRKIIKAIAPAEHVTIGRYHASLTKLHKTDPVPNATTRNVENILWTFMIVHCIENHQSYFNHKSFLKSVIFSFSDHYNLSKGELVEKMIRASAPLQEQSTSMRKCLELLNEIYVEVVVVKSDPDEKSVVSVHNRPDLQGGRNLYTVRGKDSERIWSEEWIIKALKRNTARTAALLTASLVSRKTREMISSFPDVTFKTFIGSVVSPDKAEIVKHFLLLSGKLKRSLRNNFSDDADYERKVKRCILDVIAKVIESGESNNELLFNLLMYALTSTSPRLNYRKIATHSIQFADDPELSLLNVFLKKKPFNNSSIPEGGSEINRLIAGLLATGASRSENFASGFFIWHEALQFIHDQYPVPLARAIAEMSVKKRENFFHQLQDDELDLLMSLKYTHAKTSQHSELIRQWDHQLVGLNNRKEITTALKRVLLARSIFQTHPSMDALADDIMKVLEKFNVPDSFFESIAKWTLPKYGDLALAIQKIEKKVVTAKGRAGVMKQQSAKRKILEDAVDQLKKKSARREEVHSENAADEIYISNAGLVLIHPYLPFLFEQCGFMEKGKFKNQETALRAVVLVHYAATGLEVFREEDHVLNKLLCGLAPQENSMDIILTEQERTLANGMLVALTDHWTTIKNSSADDVRGNWLVREGRLREMENCWELTVKRQPYDLLLNSLPFTLSPIKNPWMKKMIMVHWL